VLLMTGLLMTYDIVAHDGLPLGDGRLVEERKVAEVEPVDGVGDEDVDAAPLVHHGLHGGLDRVVAAEVVAHRNRLHIQ
jgi:hypothetical protein